VIVVKKYLLLSIVLFSLFIFIACGQEPAAQQQFDAPVQAEQTQTTPEVPEQPSDAMERLKRLPPPPVPGTEVVDASGALVGGESMGAAAAGGDLVGQATGLGAPSPCDLFFTLDVSDPYCNLGGEYVGNFHVQVVSQPHTNQSHPQSVRPIASHPSYSYNSYLTEPAPSWAFAGDGYARRMYSMDNDIIYAFNRYKLEDSLASPLRIHVPSEVVVFPSPPTDPTENRDLIRPVISLKGSGSKDLYLWRNGYIYNENLPNPNPSVVGNWEQFEWYWPNNDPAHPDYDLTKYPLATQFDDKLSRENWLPLSRSSLVASTGSGYPTFETFIGPDGSNYYQQSTRFDSLHPATVNLAVTSNHLAFDYDDGVTSTKVGSVIAFVCDCVPDSVSSGPAQPKCNYQSTWMCSNSTQLGQGVHNGRWMLFDFTAREAVVGTTPTDPTQ
jgi:hypothetical protein